MKSQLARASLTVGISLLTATSLLGQSAASVAPTAAAAANQPSDLSVGQREKQKAEDAALLQELESTAPAPPAGNKHRNSWAPGAGAGGGGLAVGPAGTFGQALLARPAAVPRALVVRNSSPEPKTQSALEEDLAVMSHLLGKAIDELPGAQPRTMNALGIELAFPGSSAPVRSLYIEDYGALFFLGVSFPLIAPPEKQPQEKPAGDSAWEDARQELYGQRVRGPGAGEPGEEYSQEKVEKLKTTLMEALKNASNIRELKPNESVTVWVVGGITGGRAVHRRIKNNAPGTLGGNFDVLEQPSPSRRTILTIRTTKSQIDAYAKGSLTAEEFQKKARITSYTDDAAGAGSDGLPATFFLGRTQLK